MTQADYVLSKILFYGFRDYDHGISCEGALYRMTQKILVLNSMSKTLYKQLRHTFQSYFN